MTDEFILQIMDEFNSSNIVDLDLTRKDTHISLRKKEACVASEKTVSSVAAVEVPSVSNTPVVNEVKETKAAATKVDVAPAEKASTETLKSPIVGTFYRAPSPDSPAYAEKGTKIKKGDPVCIIEAMKMMNTLNADYDFEVVDVLVENGELVEFDQPLFAIKKM